MSPNELSEYIKAESQKLGFTVCGIAKAEAIRQDVVDEYRHWLAEERHGNMSYLERNNDKRFDPTQLVQGCRSIICVAQNYYPAALNENGIHISRYALGEDYHKVIKDKLYILLQKLNDVTPTKGRPFCDSAPVMERYWAQRAGLGWIGKNRQLIIPKAGSYFFLGELFVDIELEYDKSFEKAFCGNCDACLRNCPTGALSEDGFDARRCLSYLTIEYREELPKNIGEKMRNCIYGCDRCMLACPHNRFASPNSEERFKPKQELLLMSNDDWKNLTPQRYDELFEKTAVERCGYEQLLRNINALTN